MIYQYLNEVIKLYIYGSIININIHRYLWIIEIQQYTIIKWITSTYNILIGIMIEQDNLLLLN